MKRKKIEVADFKSNPFAILDKQWMLLTAGPPEKYNTMTVSWGFMGTFWSEPLVIAGVRPQRYTHEFMEANDSFTLTAFPPSMRDALSHCGLHSGRDADKAAECGLTPIPATSVASTAFDQAELIIECRKIYVDVLKENSFIDRSLIAANYPKSDYHTLYFGRVTHVEGLEFYF